MRARVGTQRWRQAVGERIRDTRCAKPMTQADLGEECGLVQSAVCHFEKARRMPSVANLTRLASALGVSTDYLLGVTA